MATRIQHRILPGKRLRLSNQRFQRSLSAPLR